MDKEKLLAKYQFELEACQAGIENNQYALEQESREWKKDWHRERIKAWESEKAQYQQLFEQLQSTSCDS